MLQVAMSRASRSGSNSNTFGISVFSLSIAETRSERYGWYVEGIEAQSGWYKSKVSITIACLGNGCHLARPTLTARKNEQRAVPRRTQVGSKLSLQSGKGSR